MRIFLKSLLLILSFCPLISFAQQTECPSNSNYDGMYAKILKRVDLDSMAYNNDGSTLIVNQTKRALECAGKVFSRAESIAEQGATINSTALAKPLGAVAASVKVARAANEKVDNDANTVSGYIKDVIDELFGGDEPEEERVVEALGRSEEEVIAEYNERIAALLPSLKANLINAVQKAKKVQKSRNNLKHAIRLCIKGELKGC